MHKSSVDLSCPQIAGPEHHLHDAHCCQSRLNLQACAELHTPTLPMQHLSCPPALPLSALLCICCVFDLLGGPTPSCWALGTMYGDKTKHEVPRKSAGICLLLVAGEAKWALGGLAIAAVSDALDGFIARTVSVGWFTTWVLGDSVCSMVTVP